MPKAPELPTPSPKRSKASIVTLTTDFGLSDAYVAAMKGVILSINPKATIVDVSHQVPPQNLAHAAFVVGMAYHCFPKDTIHVVVVDPEVGTQRKGLLLVTPQAKFLAPDNGVLSFVLFNHFDYGERPQQNQGLELFQPFDFSLPPAIQGYQLTNPRFWRHPVSSTFHGRDIFTPVAAHLSKGAPPEEMGERVEKVTYLHIPSPRPRESGSLEGVVIHIDTFGNLITNIQESQVEDGMVVVEVGGPRILGLSQTYAEGRDFVALIGSHGYVEVSIRNGSAAKRLGVRVGDRVGLQKKAGTR